MLRACAHALALLRGAVRVFEHERALGFLAAKPSAVCVKVDLRHCDMIQTPEALRRRLALCALSGLPLLAA
eukprot:13375604-Alexandrium_andersonii.AAC.1